MIDTNHESSLYVFKKGIFFIFNLLCKCIWKWNDKKSVSNAVSTWKRIETIITTCKIDTFAQKHVAHNVNKNIVLCAHTWFVEASCKAVFFVCWFRFYQLSLNSISLHTFSANVVVVIVIGFVSLPLGWDAHLYFADSFVFRFLFLLVVTWENVHCADIKMHSPLWQMCRGTSKDHS